MSSVYTTKEYRIKLFLVFYTTLFDPISRYIPPVKNGFKKGNFDNIVVVKMREEKSRKIPISKQFMRQNLRHA